ncbi:hypothetical protein [Nonomuraea sp. NPDC052265]|uniref:hypothetical protein n=1 Tax=Nonomuraea sp. NPDC052265 TaxID=3364374 RepID=UPI0037CC3C3E
MITPGAGVNVTGNGSASNPYVVSATGTTDCEVIQDCVGQALGNGLAYDDANNRINAKISADAGNAMVIGGDGGLYAAGGGGGGGLTTVAVQDTPCIDLGGLGTVPQPLTATPIINAAAGNLLSCTATGLRAALTVGTCGLTGNGSAASPLAARVGTWPYPCAIDANAGGVYCDSTGTLRSEPRGRTDFVQSSQNQTLPSTAVPTGFDNVIATRTMNITNPDPCRTAFVFVEVEVDIDFDLPANSGAAGGITTDEMQYFANRGGSTASDVHCQVTKVYNRAGGIGPGASAVESLDITMGRGSGGATYNRIQHFMRAFLIIV